MIKVSSSATFIIFLIVKSIGMILLANFPAQLSSAHINLTHLALKSLIWPELTDCQTIVVANKKNNDGLYFSRINIDQLIQFLNKCHYPQAIIEHAEKNRDQLDHMLYDVGIDYVMEDGNINILKSAYYGFF